MSTKYFFEEKIYFYEPDGEFGWLANFSSDAIVLDGVFYKTVEHFFQAQKFIHSKTYHKIIESETPSEAKAIAKANKKYRRKDWDLIKKEIMLTGIKAKFAQHHNLERLLLSTGNCVLIEKSSEDFFWGAGSDESGLNIMGKLLMQLRRELNEINHE